MKIKHYGTGDYRVRHEYDWQTLEYYYFFTLSEARASLRQGDQLEWWNGEVWVI